MDDATAAAIAAVVIAIFAMFVAMAQALQQYFITGQLIRICDRVVYSKMPGKGTRVWAGSQFRFRVVYTMPHICLRPDLWEDGYKHHSDLVKQQLPDLRNAIHHEGPKRAGYPKRTAYSAVPGEASWASFCRVMQHTTGNDLVYELVEGDADRCPSDLSVIPMLVSLRDIVTIALTAGMTCSSASFTEKTIAMEGRAGTITSSLHPILGALLRFTPKSFEEPPGIRMCDGSVDLDWMVRMWDVLVVAGRRYSPQDRKYYAAYESDEWTLSTDMAIVRYMGQRRVSRASSPTKSVRRSSHVDGLTHELNDASILTKSPQDGEWSFETTNERDPNRIDEAPQPTNRWRHRVLPDTFATFSRNHPMRGASDRKHRAFKRPLYWSEDFAYKTRGRELLDGFALQNYIDERRRAKSPSPTRNRLLLLPSVPGEGAKSEEWHSLYAELSHERAASFARRWRDVIERRQKQREKKDLGTDSVLSSRQTSRVRSSSLASQRSQRSFRSVEEPRGRSREWHAGKRHEPVENVVYGVEPLHSAHDGVPPESPSSIKRSSSHERIRTDGRQAHAVAFEYSLNAETDVQEPSTEDTSGIRRVRGVKIASTPAVDIEESSKHNSPNGMTWEAHITPRADEPRSILRRPRAHFPEDPHPVREGVAPLRQRSDLPEGARWTKIERRLVSPEALIAGGERFEERSDHVIVLRVLTRDEIGAYAALTKTMRDRHELSKDATGDEGVDKYSLPSNGNHTTEFAEQVDSEVRTVTEQSEPMESGNRDNRFRRSRSPSQERLRSIEPKLGTTRPAHRGHSPSQASQWSATIDMQRDFSPMKIELGEGSVTDGLVSSTDFSQFDGNVSWFWICQADVVPGYFATPWQNLFSASVCSGAIAVMTTALEWFTDDASLCYVDDFPHCETWIYQGRTTHPSYAINAMGGVVVSARYKRVKFEPLSALLPPIQLLIQEKKHAHTVVRQLSELMALDSWLSFCGRLPEIYNGRSNLIRRMPALIQKLMVDFAYEFGNVDRTAAEGGWQLMKEMADLVLYELDQLMLDEAEQLFTLVAVLRAAKMALCVIQGSSTLMLQEILLKDAQVYMT